MTKSFIISSIKLRNTSNNIEVNRNTVLSSQPLLIPKEAIVDEYAIYCKIEKHMELSIDIHHIYKQTQSTLTSLQKAKPLLTKSNSIYNALKDITNPLNFAALINELDEALFNDCGCFDTFWVQDKEYKLESLYYKHESWSDDISQQTVQPFHFNEEPTINLDEGMYLIMLCDKWTRCLETANAISENTRLTLTVNRFEKRVGHFLHSIIEHMLVGCVNDEQLSFVHHLKDTRKCFKKN